MNLSTLRYRAEVHLWPWAYHPLLGGGSTLPELTEEVAEAVGRGRSVRVAFFDDWIEVTLYIPR